MPKYKIGLNNLQENCPYYDRDNRNLEKIILRNNNDMQLMPEKVINIKEYGYFDIGGACYPECHPECNSLEKDIDNTCKNELKISMKGTVPNGGTIQIEDGKVTGVSEEYIDIGKLVVTNGRFLNFADVDKNLPVCVVGTYIISVNDVKL